METIVKVITTSNFKVAQNLKSIDAAHVFVALCNQQPIRSTLPNDYDLEKISSLTGMSVTAVMIALIRLQTLDSLTIKQAADPNMITIQILQRGLAKAFGIEIKSGKKEDVVKWRNDLKEKTGLEI
jgi:hypothetical protein